jgi:hypothetical protein
VYVQDWQQQCCGTPFAVGDRVSWHLAFDQDLSGFEAVEATLDRAEVVRVHVSADGHEEVELRIGGLSAWWEGPVGVRRGLLREEHHDRAAARAATEGVVRRIREVRQTFVWSETHAAWAPSGAPVALTDIASSEAMGCDRDVTGMIADLEVG